VDLSDDRQRGRCPPWSRILTATGFVGLSHLGIVSSVAWASFAEPVIAVDLDCQMVGALRQGILPVHEPSLEELFGRVRQRMTFSADPSLLRDCSLVIVARDVPTDEGNASDTSIVLGLIDAIVPHLRQGVSLALMSQVPPGFTRRLAQRIRAQRPALEFQLYYWMETLVFGNAVERALRPERIIIGCADPAIPVSTALDTRLREFGCPIFRMGYESAELTKTAINLYLCAAVTYANTLSDLCERMGADWAEMMPALRLDRRIGPAAYIRPGLGIGGGNLERDMVTLRGLCHQHGVDATFIETLIDSNARRPEWVMRTLDEHLFPEVARPVVAVWGLAYKKNTRSTKNSMSLRVIRALDGRAEVRAYDPVVDAGDVDLGVRILNERDETLTGADCLLVLTDWDEFAVPPAGPVRSMRRRLIVDAVGIVDAGRADLRGVRLVQMGRPHTASE
jgi:UDPglucose 6-dehydrogenase